MTPERLDECLSIIRWTPETLARCFECDVSLVEAWLSDETEIPPKAAAWIETVAAHMEIAETLKPKSLKGKLFQGESSIAQSSRP
jgi:hypothetical protein